MTADNHATTDQEVAQLLVDALQVFASLRNLTHYIDEHRTK